MNASKIISFSVILMFVTVSHSYAGPLHKAVEDGDIKSTQTFLEKNHNVNEIDSVRNQSPLRLILIRIVHLHLCNHEASMLDNALMILTLLLEHGADVDMVGSDGLSALQFAAEKFDIELFKKLFNKSRKMWTEEKTIILHHAARTKDDKQRSIVEFLLTKNIDPNLTETSPSTQPGATALHIAVMNHNCNIAQLLIQFGANTSIAITGGTYKGKTPFQMAQESGNNEMIKIVRKQ